MKQVLKVVVQVLHLDLALPRNHPQQLVQGRIVLVTKHAKELHHHPLDLVDLLEHDVGPAATSYMLLEPGDTKWPWRYLESSSTSTAGSQLESLHQGLALWPTVPPGR